MHTKGKNMKNETVKKLAAPAFYFFAGVSALLLMLVEYGRIAAGIPVGYSVYDIISFGEGSLEKILTAVLFPFGKQVGAPFLLTLLSIAFILFFAVSALLVISGIYSALCAFGKAPMKIRKLDVSCVSSFLMRTQVILLVVCDLLFVICAFLNLYTAPNGAFIGLKPDAGFYVITVAFAVIFVVHELFIKKNPNGIK